MIEEEGKNEITCPNCGSQQAEWTENNGQGYAYEGMAYCCQGCAEGSGCTCG